MKQEKLKLSDKSQYTRDEDGKKRYGTPTFEAFKNFFLQTEYLNPSLVHKT